MLQYTDAFPPRRLGLQALRLELGAHVGQLRHDVLQLSLRQPEGVQVRCPDGMQMLIYV